MTSSKSKLDGVLPRKQFLLQEPHLRVRPLSHEPTRFLVRHTAHRKAIGMLLDITRAAILRVTTAAHRTRTDRVLTVTAEDAVTRASTARDQA